MQSLQTYSIPAAVRISGIAIIVCLVYLIVILGLSNGRTFTVNDNGVKFIQAQAFAANNLQSFIIPESGRAIDPVGNFSPLINTPFFYTGEDGNTYGIYSNLFTLLIGTGYRILGVPGLYLITIFSAGGLALSINYLYWCIDQKRSLLPALIACFASPLLVFSVDLWEYMLLIFLSTLSLALLFDGLGVSADWKKVAVAGLIMGLSVWLRAEMYVLLPACALAIFWISRKIGPIIIFAAVASVPVLLLMGVNYVQAGSIMGGHVRAALASAPITYDIDGLQTRLEFVTAWLVPTMSFRWLAIIVLLVVGRIAVIFAPARLRATAWVVLSAAIILLVGFNFVYDLLNFSMPLSIVRAFPLVFLLIFVGRAPAAAESPSVTSRRFVQALWLMVIVFTIGVSAIAAGSGGPAQWGPRFLLPMLPMLIVLLVHIWQTVVNRAGRTTLVGRAVTITFGILVIISALIQLQGIRDVRSQKQSYERVVTATELSNEPIVVTNIWWMAHMQADLFFDRTFFLVNYNQSGTIDDLLAIFDDQNIDSFLYITTPNTDISDITSVMPDASDWQITSRQTEQLWLELEFIQYERA